MKFSAFCVSILTLFLLGACENSGPKSALDNMAQALKNNSPAEFLAQMDLKAFAANHLKNMTENDTALSSLNALGKAFGLGNIDSFIGNLVDVQGSLQEQFERGVASGELMAQCRRAETPDCPWVPESLASAPVIEVGSNAAIAKVTTPTRLTSWLALHKNGEKWEVVGQAVLESRARAYALAAGSPKPAEPVNTAPAKIL